MRLLTLTCSLLASLMLGCVHFGDRMNSEWDRYNPFVPPGTGQKVVLRTTLIDQPAGDAFLTKDLWAAAVKPLPIEQSALLAENGLRVAIFSGTPPPEFLRLINDGSAIRPTESTVNAGDAKPIAVQGPIPSVPISYVPEIGTIPEPNTYSEVECAFVITGTDASNGKTRLTIEPRLQHGQRQGWLRPTVDGIGLAWRDGKELERFPKLVFDVALSPNDFLVIGPSETPAERLGGAFFFTHADDRARMRVLVIRGWQLNPATNTRSKPTSIAAQASVPVVHP